MNTTRTVPVPTNGLVKSGAMGERYRHLKTERIVYFNGVEFKAAAGFQDISDDDLQNLYEHYWGDPTNKWTKDR